MSTCSSGIIYMVKLISHVVTENVAALMYRKLYYSVYLQHLPVLSPTASCFPVLPSGKESGKHRAARAMWHRPQAPGKKQFGWRSSSSSSFLPLHYYEPPAQRLPVAQAPLCPPPSCPSLSPCGSSTACLSCRLCPAWICWGAALSIRPPLLPRPPVLHLRPPQAFQICHPAALRSRCRGSCPCRGRFGGS